MYILGVAFSGNDIYLTKFERTEDVIATSEKFTLADDNGKSLRELYNYLDIYMKTNGIPEKIILETVAMGLRMPSMARIKAEGISEVVFFDNGLADKVTKIKTQKAKKKYKEELPWNPLWIQLKSVKYFSKIDQIVAFAILEGYL